MTEHGEHFELTREDIRFVLELGADRAARGHDKPAVSEVLAALPSRQPKDPDAGLGAQPWYLGAMNVNKAQSIWAGQEHIVLVHARPEERALSPAAVARAILAAPKAIKLAREVRAAHARTKATYTGAITELKRLDALASEVLSIVDGSDQHG